MLKVRNRVLVGTFSVSQRPPPGTPSGQQRATVYSVGGRHSTTPRPGTMANCYRSCRSVRYPSPCPNLGRCPVKRQL